MCNYTLKHITISNSERTQPQLPQTIYCTKHNAYMDTSEWEAEIQRAASNLPTLNSKQKVKVFCMRNVINKWLCDNYTDSSNP